MKRILMFKIMNLGSETPPNKHMEEQKLTIKLRIEKLKKKSVIMTENPKFDLNFAPKTEEYESS